MADLNDAEGSGEAGDDTDVDDLRARASATEVLRHRDIATMSAREREQQRPWAAALRPRPPRRRTHR